MSQQNPAQVVESSDDDVTIVPPPGIHKWVTSSDSEQEESYTADQYKCEMGRIIGELARQAVWGLHRLLPDPAVVEIVEYIGPPSDIKGLRDTNIQIPPREFPQPLPATVPKRKIPRATVADMKGLFDDPPTTIIIAADEPQRHQVNVIIAERFAKTWRQPLHEIDFLEQNPQHLDCFTRNMPIIWKHRVDMGRVIRPGAVVGKVLEAFEGGDGDANLQEDSVENDWRKRCCFVRLPKYGIGRIIVELPRRAVTDGFIKQHRIEDKDPLQFQVEEYFPFQAAYAVDDLMAPFLDQPFKNVILIPGNGYRSHDFQLDAAYRLNAKYGTKISKLFPN